MAEWQPIETAPKDGATPVLVAVRDARGIEICVAQYIHWDGGGKQWCYRLDRGFSGLPGRDAPIVGSGLVAADLIIVPCRPLDIDIEASEATIHNAMRAKRRYAYLMNIAQPNTMDRAKKYAQALQEAGHPVAPIIIVQRIDVPDAIAAGTSAQEADPKGKSASEFRDLLAWITKELRIR